MGGARAKSATEPLRLLFYFNYFSLAERVDFTDVALGDNVWGTRVNRVSRRTYRLIRSGSAADAAREDVAGAERRRD